MNTEEQWEVEAGAEHYQADLETIKTRIREGRIKATDRVRKGGLDWTKISLVPQLRDVTADQNLIADQAVQGIKGKIPNEPTGNRSCDVCAEEIRAAALRCRYCGAVSVQPEWRKLYQEYMTKDRKEKDLYWAAMEKSKRDYFERVIDFIAAETSDSQEVAGTQGATVQGATAQSSDLSSLTGYYYYTSNSSKWKTIIAYNEEKARELIERELPSGVTVTKIATLPVGRFSCPRCGNKYTTSKRDIGCAIMIIIFISLGLGLIMIPFLPHACKCLACEHRWKA